jgi:hypothetical protein
MPSRGALWPLLVVATGLTLAWVAYAVMEIPVSWAAESLTGSVLSWFLVLWVVDDARLRRQTPCHDFGFLVLVFLPVSLAWYLLWSRGWRGILLLGLLLLLHAAPPLSAVVIDSLRSV